jgi:hypothetical protein
MKRVVFKGTGRGNRAPRGGIFTTLDMKKDDSQARLVSNLTAPSATSCVSASTSSNQEMPLFATDSTTTSSSSSSVVTSFEPAVVSNGHRFNPSRNVDDTDTTIGLLLNDTSMQKLATFIQQLHDQPSSTFFVPTTNQSSKSILSTYQSLVASTPPPAAWSLPSLLLSLLSTEPVHSQQDDLIPLLLLHHRHQQQQQQVQQQIERPILQQLFHQLRFQEQQQQHLQNYITTILINQHLLQ